MFVKWLAQVFYSNLKGGDARKKGESPAVGHYDYHKSLATLESGFVAPAMQILFGKDFAGLPGRPLRCGLWPIFTHMVACTWLPAHGCFRTVGV
jgi:hypothetical protein